MTAVSTPTRQISHRDFLKRMAVGTTWTVTNSLFPERGEMAREVVRHDKGRVVFLGSIRPGAPLTEIDGPGGLKKTATLFEAFYAEGSGLVAQIQDLRRPASGWTTLRLTPTAVPDFRLEHQGTVVLVCPQTRRAQAWLNENVEAEGWQWLGRNLAVDPGSALDLRTGMIDAGLVEGAP